MKRLIHRKNYSEIPHSTKMNLNYPENVKITINNKINEEQSKDLVFSESFSDIPKIFNMNLEEISELETNPIFAKNNNHTNFNNKVTNKNFIKIITNKFHDLFLKLVNQIKLQKIEINNLRKNTKSNLNNNEEKSEAVVHQSENIYDPLETETEMLKYLMSEELDCFNQILFDSNIQLNELQAQEESLRREILKKHKEIEKFNLDIEECKRQKEIYIKELQNIAIKLTEYKSIIQSQGSLYKKSECDCQNKDYDDRNRGRSSVVENFEDEEDEFNIEEFQLLLNAENREYMIKKILQENRKYKSIVKVMKTEEAEFGNYLIQLETELDNFSKFKNFCLSKMNSIDENVLKCRDMVDSFSDKINNIEFHLEIYEDGGNNFLTTHK